MTVAERTTPLLGLELARSPESAKEYKGKVAPDWCPGCGDFGVLNSLQRALFELEIKPHEIHLFTCQAGEHRNFLDCVKSRKSPYFPVEIGHRVSTVCHLANISLRLGRKLQWDPDKEEFLNDDQANQMRSRSMRAPWHL